MICTTCHDILDMLLNCSVLFILPLSPNRGQGTALQEQRAENPGQAPGSKLDLCGPDRLLCRGWRGPHRAKGPACQKTVSDPKSKNHKCDSGSSAVPPTLRFTSCLVQSIFIMASAVPYKVRPALPCRGGRTTCATVPANWRRWLPAAVPGCAAQTGFAPLLPRID